MNAPEKRSGIPLWKLERYLLGELPLGEAEAIAARAGKDPGLAEAIAALRADDSALAEDHPTARGAGAIWNRLRAEAPPRAGTHAAPKRMAPRRSAWFYGIPALAALALLSLLPYRALIGPVAADPSGETTRLKGDAPALFLHRKAGDGSAPLAPGASVRAGEWIQIQYDAAGKAYGAIFSIDSRGEVTWHWPDSPGSAPLKAGSRVALDFAFELDSLPGEERFFFIAADRPFRFEIDFPGLLPSLRAPDSPELPLPPGFSRARFTLRKETGT